LRTGCRPAAVGEQGRTKTEGADGKLSWFQALWRCWICPVFAAVQKPFPFAASALGSRRNPTT